MSTHFLAAGFDVSQPDELKKLAHQAIKNGKFHKGTRKSLGTAAFEWDAGRGLHVWVVANAEPGGFEDEPTIVSCQSGFVSEQIQTIPAYRLEKHPDRPGEVVAVLRTETGVFRCSLLNLWKFKDLPTVGVDLDLAVTGFVLEADEMDSEPVIRLKEDAEGQVVTNESFLVPLDRDCHHKVAGRVLEIAPFANFHTGHMLERWRLGIGGMQLDLVAPAELRPARMSEGYRLEALCWLHGFLVKK